MTEMTMRQYANHRGVSLQAVQRAVETGRIKIHREVKKGKKQVWKYINVDVADKSWDALTDPTEQKVATRADMGKRRPVINRNGSVIEHKEEGADESAAESPSSFDSKSKIGEKSGSDTYYKARSANEIFKAKTAELEYRKLLGDLVDKKALENKAYEIGQRVCERVLNVPGRVSVILAAKTSAREIEMILSGELRAALTEVANGITFSE